MLAQWFAKIDSLKACFVQQGLKTRLIMLTTLATATRGRGRVSGDERTDDGAGLELWF